MLIQDAIGHAVVIYYHVGVVCFGVGGGGCISEKTVFGFVL